MSCEAIKLPPADSELVRLVDAMCDGAISPAERDRLESLLTDDLAAKRYYVAYLDLHAQMQWFTRGEQGVGAAIDRQPAAQSPEPNDSSINIKVSGPLPVAFGQPAPFVGSLPFSYMVATVVMCVILLSAWAYKITLPSPSADNTVGRLARVEPPQPVFVGRVTGIADCRWTGQSAEPFIGAYVSVGSKYSLDAGLLEITYDDGARVILQGRCKYEVDSRRGGYLAIGKLTARVEVGGGESGNRRIGDSGIRGVGRAKGQVDRNDTAASSAPLFAIRTPSAIVTDLGTEFGVEVDEVGETVSHVFQGSVVVQATDGGGLPRGAARVLKANESVRVITADNGRVTVGRLSARSADFVRSIPQTKYKTLDLVDIVAGGDGFSARRNLGIDPTNGRSVSLTPEVLESCAWFAGDGKCHPVESHPFVDCVFVPDGQAGPVRVDSADHTFAGFPDTCNATWKHIWAVGDGHIKLPFTAVLEDVDYAASPHGQLFMHANSGITFDLQAIRRAMPDAKLLRFIATAGSSSKAIYDERNVLVISDIWVLVDGRVRFERRGVDGYGYSGVFRVSIPLGGDDRFLTLATTDGGNGSIHGDWTMFGDPRIVISQTEMVKPELNESVQINADSSRDSSKIQD